jgi:Fe2+ transport system protein B
MKIINIILGLGTAMILSALIDLGIRAFHPEPVYTYNDPALRQLYSYTPKAAYSYPERDCEKNVKCLEEQKEFYEEERERQEEMREKENEYQDKVKVYNRDVFIIANIVGIIVFVSGFLLLFKTAIQSQSVLIGVMIAGLYSIIYGYVRGWNSTNDQLKFFVGLVIAISVIGGSIWLIERYSRRRHA